AILVNYPLARRAVFLSNERHRSTLPRYLLLVGASGALSFGLLNWLQHGWGISVLRAKVLAESALFIVNFLAQRDWVFVRRTRESATDWDRYYRSPVPTAHLTRRYTGRGIVAALRRYAGKGDALAELGGANSCFLETIQKEIAPREYHVIDNNAYGLSLLDQRGVIAHHEDCLDLRMQLQADAVFSIGLIEHFDRMGTRRAVASHFALV